MATPAAGRRERRLYSQRSAGQPCGARVPAWRRGCSRFSMAGNSSDESASSDPVIKLVAATKAARACLDGRSELTVRTFPFNAGRESRVASNGKPARIEQRLGIAAALNDVHLLEPPWADILHISREHFAIEYTDNQFFLVDRCSACGTFVAGTRVGGNRTGGRIEIESGDELIVGTETSPFVFRFEIVP